MFQPATTIVICFAGLGFAGFKCWRSRIRRQGQSSQSSATELLPSPAPVSLLQPIYNLDSLQSGTFTVKTDGTRKGMEKASAMPDFCGRNLESSVTRSAQLC